MPISYADNTAQFYDICEIEEAEGLLEWVLEHPECTLDFGELEHMHTAILQVCMALKPSVSSWPKEADLKIFLENVLHSEDGL